MERKQSLMAIGILFVVITIFSLSLNIFAQAKKPAFPQAPAVNSPEVLSDRCIIFRIMAPEANKVGLQSSDIFGMTQANLQFTKNNEGIWEGKSGPLAPGAYRYTFTVDGASVVDPNNTSISESNNNVWSMVYVPGADFMEMKQVPHGAVSEVYYYSKTLGRHRRMHIYTPPGYESDSNRYPVLYLLHGAMDCDDSWSSVGRAGFIMDNLINEKKAKPMVVVMPAGHTTKNFSMGGSVSAMVDDFSKDFINEIMPCVENNYRVLTDRKNRAIAGLSMGGMQTINIAMKDLTKFAYIGVFSSGIFGLGGSTPGQSPSPDWEEEHRAMLDNKYLKKDLKLFWFATGTEDFLIDTSRASVKMLKKHGFKPAYKETDGGHTWAKWRDYLLEFTPELFN